jgi:hypothetical protein
MRGLFVSLGLSGSSRSAAQVYKIKAIVLSVIGRTGHGACIVTAFTRMPSCTGSAIMGDE